jgi:hypothetical protein
MSSYNPTSGIRNLGPHCETFDLKVKDYIKLGGQLSVPTSSADHTAVLFMDSSDTLAVKINSNVTRYIACGTAQTNLSPTFTSVTSTSVASLNGGIQGTTASPASQVYGAVTANGSYGILTFTGLVTAAGVTSATAVVTNSSCTANSQVILTMVAYGGTYATNGIPYPVCVSRANGSFTMSVSNIHGTNALAGTLTIAFMIIN